MIAGRFLAPIFFQNKMIEKMIVAEWSLTLVWNILTKWSLKWSLKNLDFEKISTILCMTLYTREIAYLHWKIGFQAVFMHVYTRNCEFTLENWFSSSFYACIHAKLHIYIIKLVFKLFYACIHAKLSIYTRKFVFKLFLCMYTCKFNFFRNILKNKTKMIAKNDRWKMIGDLRIFDYENDYRRR